MNRRHTPDQFHDLALIKCTKRRAAVECSTTGAHQRRTRSSNNQTSADIRTVERLELGIVLAHNCPLRLAALSSLDVAPI